MPETTETSRALPLLEDQSTGSNGCGCGGCGCGAAENAADSGSTITAATTTTIDEESSPATRSYAVSGMTCGHCAGAVTSELESLDGVEGVQVALVAGGTSTVTVISAEPLPETRVVAALDEAGGYQLV